MNKNIISTGVLLVLLVNISLIQLTPPQVAAQTASPTPISTLNAEEKIERMDILMGEHALIGGELLISRYANRADFQAAKRAVDANTQLIANEIGGSFGSGTKSTFLTIWNRHVNAFIKYADARKDNNSTRQREALDELQTFTTDMGNLLSGTSRNQLKYATAQDYFAQHVMAEKAILDAYIAKDFNKMYDSKHKAYEHATMMSGMLQNN